MTLPLPLAALVIAITLAGVAWKMRAQGNLPPHEFAYGAALKNSEAIPGQIEQFLSLEALDPDQIQLKTYVGFKSEENLEPLIEYISSQKNASFAPLLAALKSVDHLPNQKQKALELVKALLPYKDSLANKEEQDSVIVFVSYGLKQPSKLSQAERAKIAGFVKQLDTDKQSAKFESGECPENYLVGNINIYPLALDNTMWHDNAAFAGAKDAPILEIRFMGLKGIFRYLLDEMTAKTGDTFVHVDGETI